MPVGNSLSPKPLGTDMDGKPATFPIAPIGSDALVLIMLRNSLSANAATVGRVGATSASNLDISWFASLTIALLMRRAFK